MDSNIGLQMEPPLKKNILIRYDSASNADLPNRNTGRPRRDVKTISKLKMTLPRLKPPSSQSKVSHWLNDCSHINFNPFERPQASLNGLLQAPPESQNGLPPPLPLDFDIDVSIEDRTVKQNILVRQDFHKNEVEKPSENVPDVEIRQSVDSNSSTETKRKLLNNAPLSPESRKKNELCSYLQLMDLKHPELKNGNVYKNRRSTRVKNLLIMTEKKELECKLRDEAKVKENSCSQTQEMSDILSKKSFQELNMLTECELVQNVGSTSFTEFFRPIHVPKHLLYKKVDFEEFVADYVSERRSIAKKEKYAKAKKMMAKEKRHEAMRKLHLQRLKTLRKKQSATIKNSKPLRKKYVEKNRKKTVVKSPRSVNRVILRSKTLRNLRKRNQNLLVKAENREIKNNTKRKQEDAVTGKENLTRKSANDKKMDISRRNDLNLRRLRNSLEREKVRNAVKPKHKTKEIVNKNNLKTKKKQNLEKATEPQGRNNFKIIKYDFERSADNEIVKAADGLENKDSTKVRYDFVQRTDGTQTETSEKQVVDDLDKADEFLPSEKAELEGKIDETLNRNVSSEVMRVNGPQLIGNREVDEDEEIEVKDSDCDNSAVGDVQVKDTDGTVSNGDGDGINGVDDGTKVDDDDDVIYMGTEIISAEKQGAEISTAQLISDHHDLKPTFSAKTLEDIEKKYSNLSFNVVGVESDEDTSSISEACIENTVYITGSACSDDDDEYQINIAISEHNYTRSPGSVPIEYELVECESIVEPSSSLPEGDGVSENPLDLLQMHTLEEIRRIIHGDVVVTEKASDVKHDAIEDVADETSMSKTPDAPCDTILNITEENLTEDFESAYKLNFSNDSKEEERDLTCDIAELQSSLKPIKNNGSHEDFRGFSNRQSPKLIEFNENNLPKSMIRSSLHRNLLQNKRKLSKNSDNNSKDDFDSSAWTTEKNEKRSAHTIGVQEKDGEVLNAFYFDYNLIITQDLMISFWTQSALGFVLEAQNMWIPRGSIQRLALDSNCVQKGARECVLAAENSFAYVELWTKEHKSDKRERPVADVFAVVYFWRNRQMGPEKKFLQLENINGFADDVQYVVLKNSAMILVSWRIVRDETTSSIIHCYQLANDFQTVVSIKEMESVEHTISSLHNIEDCDTLVMGCGEKQVTIWNLEHGFIVATIDTSDSFPEPLNLWVKCDRSFLFLLQHCSNNVFKLIAINGINHSWKRLQIYKPPPMGFDRFRGVCIENGILIAFYGNGILCWNVQSGDLIMEELCTDVKYLPSGKHIITYTSDNLLQVKNALSFLITNYDFSES